MPKKKNLGLNREQRREKNVAAVEITADFIQAVGQEKFERLKFIIQQLAAMGHKRPMLIRDTIRDAYLTGELPEQFYAQVKNGWTQPTNKEIQSGEKPRIPTKLKIDLPFRNTQPSTVNMKYRGDRQPWITALCADAPINSGVMGANNKVYAHPNFQRDCTERLYIVRDDLKARKIRAAEYQFKQAGQRYGHLNLVVPHDNVGQSFEFGSYAFIPRS